MNAKALKYFTLKHCKHCLLLLLLSYFPDSSLAGDKTVRDAAGNIIATTATTASGTEIVRNASGAITGTRSVRRNADGSQTITTRDPNGKITGTEEHRRK